MPLTEYLVRMFGATRSAGADKAKSMTEDGDGYVVPSWPPYTEMSRQGEGYSVITTSAVAGLVVRPSTVAKLTLYNGEGPGTGKSLIIDRAFAFNLVGAASSTYHIWLCVHQKGMTIPASDIAKGVTTNWKGNTGKQYNGSAIADIGATVVDDGWYPWGPSGSTVTVTTPGQAICAEVAGRLIVPPTSAISIQVVADVTGATFTCGLSWYEKYLPGV